MNENKESNKIENYLPEFNEDKRGEIAGTIMSLYIWLARVVIGKEKISLEWLHKLEQETLNTIHNLGGRDALIVALKALKSEMAYLKENIEKHEQQ